MEVVEKRPGFEALDATCRQRRATRRGGVEARLRRRRRRRRMKAGEKKEDVAVMVARMASSVESPVLLSWSG
jgi:hypothetical protein